MAFVVFCHLGSSALVFTKGDLDSKKQVLSKNLKATSFHYKAFYAVFY